MAKVNVQILPWLALLLFTLFPTTAFADDEMIGDFTFNLDEENRTAEVVRGPSEGFVNIPNSIEFKGEIYTVTSIGERAFQNGFDIKSVVIPNSVESIGDSAFMYCYSLTSVNIPNSVKSIGCSAFYECTSLTAVEIPDSLNEIAESTFNRCSSLASVNIPNSVTSIGDYAFYSTALTSINIPNSVISLGEGVFSHCNSLVNVNIPESVTEIPSDTFCECQSLTSFTIPSWVTSIGNNAFCWTGLTAIVIPNAVTTIGNNAFSGCKELTSVSIPSSVAKIAEGTFNRCEKLESVIISESVSEIGDYAFGYCQNLTSLKIPNSVKTIGKSAFRSSGLYSVTIPDLVTVIPDFTFYECNKLKSVIIGESVSSIGDYAFDACYELTTIDVKALTPPSVETSFIDSYVLSHYMTLNVDNSVLNKYLDVYPWNQFAIINGTVSDNDIRFSFQGAEAEIVRIGYNQSNSVEVPSEVQNAGMTYTVTSLGQYAFSEYPNLVEITLPSTIKTINEKTFANCEQIATLRVNAIVPPTFTSSTRATNDAFSTGVYENASLIVPDAAYEEYSAADVWSNFKKIVKASQSGIEIIPTDSSYPVPEVYFDLTGKHVENPTDGIYIKVQYGKAAKVLIK